MKLHDCLIFNEIRKIANIFGVLYYDVISSAMFVSNGAAFKRRGADADCTADPASRSTLTRNIVLQI